MSKVISSYFDDAHRGLQRQQSDAGRGVQLPPLRPNSGPAATGDGADREAPGYDKANSPGLMQSQSMGSLEFSHEQVTRGLQADSYQQVLQDNSKLARKVRSLQDQLAITSAKKDAFMAQAQRLEREFKKGREQSDTLQRELLEAKREAGQLTKDASEAMAMMSEMRKAHIHEVRLLQRGLQARSQDASMRNRVNDVADLVDKVGRAVVQRDEAIRDRTKAQVQVEKAAKDLRILHEECGQLKRQNKQLQAKLKEAKRKGKFVTKKPETSAEPPDDSDEDFESELALFEKRFQIMEEGPAGLDILASNLSKDKQALEKQLKSQAEAMKKLNGTLEAWKRECGEKDEKIRELNDKLTSVLRQQARLEEQVADKQREIAEAVASERARLEARIAELENDYDDARELADGMEKASSALTRELVKVHEAYARPVPGAAAGPSGAAEGADAGDKGEQLAASSQKSKTGEQLKLGVFRKGEDTELHAQEVPDGEACRVKLTEEVIKELDAEDPWTELFSRVGVDPGPPRRIVVASQIAQEEVRLPPSNSASLITAFRYSADRYLFSGMDLGAGTLVEVAVTEDDLTPELRAGIASCRDDSSLFRLLSRGLSLEAGGGRLAFSAAAASRP